MDALSADQPDQATERPLVVAMDGPSGSGKSSVSRQVADTLGLRYLDTGAMYRALTWWMLRNGVEVTDADAVAALASTPVLCSGTDPLGPTITVDGVDVSTPIRSREVTNAVSAVSAVPAVRTRLVDDAARHHRAVLHGRRRHRRRGPRHRHRRRARRAR